MVTFNHGTAEMIIKIVYYGPGLCGKTTNLQYIADHVSRKDRSELLSINTQTDRTLFFDLVGLRLGKISGYNTRVQLFTVPGQVFYDDTRRLVLNGADGVVFVADSQERLRDSNLTAYENLLVNLKKNCIDIETIPIVFQWNKRDMPSAVPVEDLESLLNPDGKYPSCLAVASRGEGVFETMKLVVGKAVEGLRERNLVGGKKGSDNRPSRRLEAAAGPVAAPDPESPPTRVSSSTPAALPEAAASSQDPDDLDLGGVDESVVVDRRAVVREPSSAPSAPAFDSSAGGQVASQSGSHVVEVNEVVSSAMSEVAPGAGAAGIGEEIDQAIETAFGSGAGMANPDVQSQSGAPLLDEVAQASMPTMELPAIQDPPGIPGTSMPVNPDALVAPPVITVKASGPLALGAAALALPKAPKLPKLPISPKLNLPKPAIPPFGAKRVPGMSEVSSRQEILIEIPGGTDVSQEIHVVVTIFNGEKELASVRERVRFSEKGATSSLPFNLKFGQRE